MFWVIEIDLNNNRHIEKIRKLKNLKIQRTRSTRSWGYGHAMLEPKEIPLDSAEPCATLVTDQEDFLYLTGETSKGKLKKFYCGYYSKEKLGKLQDICDQININKSV